MGIGRIASFLSSFSATAETVSADEMPDTPERRAQAMGGQADANRHHNQDPNDIASQLQTMLGAVRTLNENAVQQGAAVVMSSAGSEWRNAVSGLGHLLAAVDAKALANGAAAPVREAAQVIDAVEAGLAGTEAATEQVLRNLPALQAQRAQEVSDRFQADMRAAITQVRGVLSELNVKR